MASGWIPITELQLGSEVNDKLTLAFQKIDLDLVAMAEAISDNTDDIVVNAQAIAAVDAKIVSPIRGSLRLATNVVQSITDAAEPILLTCFDAKVSDIGDVTVDPTGRTITYTGAGLPSSILSFGLNAEFLATEELEVYVYINGAKYSDTPINVQGAGAGKPVTIFWQSDIAVATDDVIDIRGRNADAGSFDITYTRSTLRLEN